jgi:voltage-gated potassium channel
MTPYAMQADSRPEQRVITWGVLRSLLWLTLLVVLYFLGPLDELRLLPLGVSLAFAGALLLAIGAFEIRAISRSPYPGLRGIEALAVTVPLYVLLFAAGYYVMASNDPASFNVDGLTRTDTLYFTVTIFSSVGFGDIFATSQGARLLVTVQMVINLLVLGAGIRIFIGAVRRTRASRTPNPPIGTEPEL